MFLVYKNCCRNENEKANLVEAMVPPTILLMDNDRREPVQTASITFCIVSLLKGAHMSKHVKTALGALLKGANITFKDADTPRSVQDLFKIADPEEHDIKDQWQAWESPFQTPCDINHSRKGVPVPS